VGHLGRVVGKSQGVAARKDEGGFMAAMSLQF